MKNTILIFLSIFLLALSCKRPDQENSIDINQEKFILKASIENTIGWAKDKDTTLLYSIIANDENYLSVHPGNRIVKGISQFRQAEAFWLDDRFSHVSFETWDMNINISKDGSVAWFYCMLNDLNEWDGSPENWENTRWTGVLEKREGVWRMVQMHFSMINE